MNEGDEFNSFEEFQDKLLQWSTATNVIWVKSHSKTVQSANQKLSSKSKNFDQKFKFRNVLYKCKHGGAPRRSGRGLRPNQSSFKQECKARLFLSVNKEKTKLVVQNLITAHNHEVSKDAFKHYPEQRRLSEVKKKEVETMLQLGVKVKYLKEHVEKQQNQIITLKDLHNIHQKAKRERTGEKSEEELLMDELHQLCEDDPDAVISVQTNNEGVLEFLLLVTGDMKQTFAMFPEVLMIDCTYCTNRLRMPLFSLLVEDGNGSGQTVGYAFITNETENTLSAVMTEMSRIHKLGKVKVVVLDKDMKEIAAVKKVIPGADVQLCKFHVIQAVDRFINKLSIAQETKGDLKKSFQALVFSKSKSAFERSLGHLAATAPENFMAYYNKNWGKQHQVQHWAYYKTIKQINLGNTTNNRIESHNQKIKDVLKRNMTLPEAVKSIILLHTGRVNEMAHREFNHTFKTAYRLGDDDVVKDDIVKQITPYAAGIIIAELEKARFSTSKNSKDCACPLKTAMLLPCRHLFANRIEQGERLFHIEDVGERWHLAYQKRIWTCRKRPRSASTESKLSLRKRFKKNPLTKVQKFKEMMVICKSMADFASSLGTSEFNEKMDTLTTIHDAWLGGEKVMFTTGEEDPDEPYPCVQTPETPKMPTSPTSSNNMVSSPCSDDSIRNWPSPLPPLDIASPLLHEDKDREITPMPSPSSVGTCTPEGNVTPLPSPSSFGIPVYTPENSATPLPSPSSFGIYTPEKSATPMPSPSSLETHSLEEVPLTNPSSLVTPQKKENKERIGKKLSPIFSASKIASVCSTGRASEVLQDFKTLKLPKTPPVRGNARFKKGKENVFQSRQRLLKKRELRGQDEKKKENLKTVTTVDEMELIRNPKEMLTDSHINAAQKLLSEQFPKVRGLQDTILGSKLQFSVEIGDFVQVLHDGGLHWLTISNLFCDDNCVDIFDSLYTSVSMEVKMQAACIMMIQEQTVSMNVVNCIRQKGGYDCGLFAIAYATDLCCFGNDPGRKCYSQSQMRDHMLSCLTEKMFCPFPAEERDVQRRVSKSLKVPLYCICRLPDNKEEKMGECDKCKEWYHKSCISIPKHVFEDGKRSSWCCTKCQTNDKQDQMNYMHY